MPAVPRTNTPAILPRMAQTCADAIVRVALYIGDALYTLSDRAGR